MKLRKKEAPILSLPLFFLPIFQAHPHPDSLYRDNIHLSRDGNELITQKLSEAIQKVF
mgnify:CR=1 FL=1